MQTHYCLLFFRGDVTLDDAARRLATPFLTLERDGDVIVARHEDGPELVIGLDAEPHVVIEAAEIAERHAVPGLAGCDRRFEILIEDLEATLDETNTLAEVQMTLQDLTNGYLFNDWNGIVTPPE